MTLPLRKKLPTTVQSIRSQVKERNFTRRRRRRAALQRGLWLGLMLFTSQSAFTTSLHAQSPGWQPNRLPNSAAMQPLSGASSNQAIATPANAASTGDNGSGGLGVTLRWRTSARVNPSQANTSPAASQTAPAGSTALNSASSHSSLAARAWEANAPRPAAAQMQGSSHLQGSSQRLSDGNAAFNSNNVPSAANPLRSAATSNHVGNGTRTQATATFVPRGTQAAQRSAVQPANFQAPFAPPANAPGLPPAGNAAPFQPPQIQPQQIQEPPALEPNFQPAVPVAPVTPEPPAVPQIDDLNTPEAAPVPPAAPPEKELFPQPQANEPPAQDANPADPMPADRNELRPDDDLNQRMPPDDDKDNPFKNRNLDESPSDRESAQRARDLEKKKDQPDATANCESFREKLRSSSIQKINLNAAPRYGQGMNDDPEKSEKQRLDFASSSEVRDWCDRRGQAIVQGRMIDLVNEQVVLDINGVRREIPLRDLCDVDLAYVGKVWHLPVTCGSGYEQVAGRSFVPSAMQWKASGLCHKPLYFEEVQLERYGHEIGPILQPLVSTAHFFGNIAVLPYKMGIHPPGECQYALGYYRPGDCAPYMLPPVPISLRGAAVQAGAVVGAAALVP